MATENEDTKNNSASEVMDERQVVEEANSSRDFPGSKNEPPDFGVPAPELNVAPNFSQTAQQATGRPSPGSHSPDFPISTPMDAEARALIETSYRIGEASSADEYHSYSSLLLATMFADNSASRWFSRRLQELNVDPAEQKKKLGLENEQLEKLVSGDEIGAHRGKSLDWTVSAKEWLENAKASAVRRQKQEPIEVSARDLIAAFVFARNFHEGDRKQMGLGPANEGAADQGQELANGFMSFVLVHHPDEYETWAEIFKEEFNAEPVPDIVQGPATRLSSDRWTTDDLLGYRGYARAMHHFLLHPSSRPPLSISIQAPWGAGKTSLMRMLQLELDPEAVKAARAGGWKALYSNRADDSDGTPIGLGTFLKIIRGEKNKDKENGSSKFMGETPKRYTVWFNAWKYESGDQLWAGLATAIIDQFTSRMTALERERFLLGLQASRIDPAKVRAQIYELAFNETLTGLKNIWLWVRSAIPLAVGGGFQIWSETTAAASAGITATGGLLPAAVLFSALWAAGEIFTLYGKKNEEAKDEPVSTTLKDIVSVPDYESEIGFTHKVVDDLLRIFEALIPANAKEGKPTDTEWPPIVVFIDDLDRCSPRKVADVIEGVNLFLAGDFMPCVFIIGMDPQMVSAALDTAHGDIAEHIPGYDRQTPLGWRFMDKFVQLPFTIPPPGPQNLDDFTEHLMLSQEDEKIVAQEEEAARSSMDDIASGQDVHALARRMADELSSETQREKPHGKVAVRAWRNSFALRLQDKLSENFSDSQPVVQKMLREAARGFSTNPRDIKRLLNVVRFNYLLSRARVAADQPIPDAETMGRWIALTLRWPAFVRWLQWSPQHVPGADGQALAGGVVRQRLETLEHLSREQTNLESWQQKIYEELRLKKGDVQWDRDPGLRQFLADDKAKPLSAGAGLGFY
ncbi:MAG: P-loop NTPase fold protein [Pseudomonadota bacterium]